MFEEGREGDDVDQFARQRLDDAKSWRWMHEV